MTAPTSFAPALTRPAGKEGYFDLARQVRAAGLFEPSPWRAVVRVSLVGGLYGAGWAALFLLGDTWYQLLVAAYLAIVFAQVGFLGHDVGHRQIFPSPRWNNLVGLACADLATGISYGYWVDKHNRHHSHPNEVGADPDVGPGVIAWTAEQAGARTGLGRVVARHQAALFFPLALLEAVSLHVSSARALGTKPVRHTPTEAVLLLAHAAVYLGAVFLALSPLRALAFIAVQQGVFGLLPGVRLRPQPQGDAHAGAGPEA